MESDCPQLRRADGGWSPRHGSWQYRLELPARADGSRRQLRRGGFSDRTVAQDEIDLVGRLLAIPTPGDDHSLCAVADLILTESRAGRGLPDENGVRRRIAHGGDLTATMPTVGVWLDQWIAGRRKIRSTTAVSYTTNIRVHLKPALGDIRLDRLTVTHLDAMFTAIDTRNETIRAARAADDPAIRASVHGSRITGDATKQRIRGCLRAALNAAIRRGLITHNAAKHVELASGKRPKALVWTDDRVARWKVTGRRPSPVMVWAPTQTGAFLDHISGDPLYPLLHLIAYRGLRRGEACGLHWTDIDLDAAVLTVRWQITQNGRTVAMSRPKSDAGDRTIPLDAATVTVLRDVRRRQNTHRLAIGPAWLDTDLVFTHPDGAGVLPEHVVNRFRTLTRKAGLPPIRLHDLRHGAATLALAAGADMKIVQELLGHSTIVLTADTYTSVLPEVAAKTADDVARLIPRARRHDTGRTAGT